MRSALSQLYHSTGQNPLRSYMKDLLDHNAVLEAAVRKTTIRLVCLSLGHVLAASLLLVPSQQPSMLVVSHDSPNVGFCLF